MTEISPKDELCEYVIQIPICLYQPKYSIDYNQVAHDGSNQSVKYSAVILKHQFGDKPFKEHSL